MKSHIEERHILVQIPSTHKIADCHLSSIGGSLAQTFVNAVGVVRSFLIDTTKLYGQNRSATFSSDKYNISQWVVPPASRRVNGNNPKI